MSASATDLSRLVDEVIAGVQAQLVLRPWAVRAARSRAEAAQREAERSAAMEAERQRILRDATVSAPSALVLIKGGKD